METTKIDIFMETNEIVFLTTQHEKNILKRESVLQLCRNRFAQAGNSVQARAASVSFKLLNRRVLKIPKYLEAETGIDVKYHLFISSIAVPVRFFRARSKRQNRTGIEIALMER